jgi:hypothetical protein
VLYGKEMGREGVNSINMAQDRAKVCVVVNTVVDLQVPFCVESYVEMASCSQCPL